MKKSRMKKIVAVICSAALLTGLLGSMPASASPETTSYANYKNVVLVENSNGLVLGYDARSGVTILTDAASGYKFKDLSKNGVLDPYEDWRLSVDVRVADLVSKMTVAQKLGLMVHNGGLSTGSRMAVNRSFGKGAQADGSTGNGLQRDAETAAWGIPYAYSSDPLHTGTITTGKDPDPNAPPEEDWKDVPVTNVSRWPGTLGLGNTFSPEIHYVFGQTIAKEYRNSQIFQQLGPLLDQSTHPTWSRISNAVTEDYDLLVDLAQAEIKGMQITEGAPIKDYGLPAGWGKDSISAMTKHVLGTGAGEFGYEGHTDIGGWTVSPGNGYRKAIDTIAAASGIGTQPKDSVSQANAAMTQYAISVDSKGNSQYPTGILGDKRYTMVGGGYSSWLMKDYLNGEKGWNGMITSDWGIYGFEAGNNHGMKNVHGFTSDAQRLLVSYIAGMDQAGGYGTPANVTAAYNLGIVGDPTIGIPPLGVDGMNAIVDRAASHVLRTIMKVGLFENPYTDPDKADAENGSSALNAIAFDAHHKSIVMLKNSDNLLPVEMKSKTVYLNNMDSNLVDGYYNVTTDPAAADFAIVKIQGPNNSNGGPGTQPNGLPGAQTAQFAPYTKTVGRAVSLGGYWFHADGSYVKAYEVPNPAIGDYKQNMSNIGYTNPGTMSELNRVINTRAAMGNKPVILILNYRNGVVPAEFEPLVDAIVANVGGADEAYMNIISGRVEPSGMLALTLPRSMASIELSAEDVPDTTPYVDADGNVYQFGFGLNYSGRIVDERTEKYLGLSEIKSFTAKKGDTVTVPIELLPYKYGPAAVNANVYYDKSLLKLNSIAGAQGFQAISSGDRFNIATTNGKGVLDGAVAGYAVFEVIATPDDDAKLAVTFAMNTAAIDADLNPTMARFADVNVTVLSDDPLAGDITLDGKVDLADVVLLMQYISGNVKLNNKQMRAADVSKDGAVNVGDSIIIMQMCL